MEHTIHVYVENTPPLGVSHVLYEAGPGDARVAYQQVEGTRGGKELAHLRRISDVRAQGLGTELGGKGLGPVPAVQVIQSDSPAFRRERARGRRTDAAGGACHKRLFHIITRNDFTTSGGFVKADISPHWSVV